MERFIKYLYMRKNNELETPLPSINRKMMNKMKDYYKIISNDSSINTEIKSNSQDTVTPFQRLAKKMQKEINNAPHLDLDFSEMFKVLDRQLIRLPPPPKVEPEYVGKYDKNFAVTIGMQPPPEPV